MIKKLFFTFCLIATSYSLKSSFDLITSFDQYEDINKVEDFISSLQKNIDHLLIDKIHVFIKNPPKKLPAIFKSTKIIVIEVSQTPYILNLFAYANTIQNADKIIIAYPNVFFDETLFKLNYFPLDKDLICLNNSAWIFNPKLKFDLPKQIKFNDANLAKIIQKSGAKSLNLFNPSLDVLSYKYLKKIIITTSASNDLVATNLQDFKLSWEAIKQSNKILLYAGNMHEKNPSYCTPQTNPSAYKFACLSLSKNNNTHLFFNLNSPIPLPDNSVDIYQSEDVFEHLPYASLANIIDEIYRVLKPGGLLRISMPDYRCDLLDSRSIKDENGKIIFDPQGGGQFINGKVIDGGHLWFPYLENTTTLIKKTIFNQSGEIIFLHYYDQKNHSITKQIDYSICYVRRTPDHDGRVSNPYRAMSIVVDLIKKP